ncbi:Proteasome subunit beta [subsurface metagenome]
MTLIIGIIAKDGVILASDSRMSSTLTANDTVEKIFELDEHNAVGISGDGTLASHIFDIIIREHKLNFTKGIHLLAEELRSILVTEFFEKYYSSVSPKEREELNILLVGYSNDTPIQVPQIYNLSSGDNFIPRQSPAGHHCIGIPYLADYLLNRLYEKGKITTPQAAKLAVFCIRETISQDRRVGGDIKVATFSDTKKFSMLSQQEISELDSQCEEVRLLHKNKFYPEEKESGSINSEDATKQIS